MYTGTSLHPTEPLFDLQIPLSHELSAKLTETVTWLDSTNLLLANFQLCCPFSAHRTRFRARYC